MCVTFLAWHVYLKHLAKNQSKSLNTFLQSCFRNMHDTEVLFTIFTTKVYISFTGLVFPSDRVRHEVRDWSVYGNAVLKQNIDIYSPCILENQHHTKFERLILLRMNINVKRCRLNNSNLALEELRVLVGRQNKIAFAWECVLVGLWANVEPWGGSVLGM